MSSKQTDNALTIALTRCPLAPAGNETEFAHHYVESSLHDIGGRAIRVCARCLQQVAYNSTRGIWTIYAKGLPFVSAVSEETDDQATEDQADAKAGDESLSRWMGAECRLISLRLQRSIDQLQQPGERDVDVVRDRLLILRNKLDFLARVGTGQLEAGNEDKAMEKTGEKGDKSRV